MAIDKPMAEMSCWQRLARSSSNLDSVADSSCAFYQMMSGLLSVRPTTFTSFGADLSLEATCNLIAAAACSESLTDLSLKVCQRVLELSMKSRREEVQTAAARAIGAISRYKDCSVELNR